MWIVAPMAHPNRQYLNSFKDKGFKLAIQVTTEELREKIDDLVDIVIVEPYITFVKTTEIIIKEVLKYSPKLLCSMCDEVELKSNHTSDDVIRIYLEHFPDNFGVLSPKGDRYGSSISVQQPIVSINWYNKFGVLPRGYNHYYPDTEIYYRAKKLGKLVEDERINFYHHHWSRESKKPREWHERDSKLNQSDRELYEYRIKLIDEDPTKRYD